MKLYSYWRSTAAYRVRIALNLKGLDFEYVPVNLVKDGGEQHGSAFRAVNPQGRVPVLVDGDVTISQSLAIIEYLEEKYPAPRLLPASFPERAFARQIALAVACDIHPLNNVSVLAYLSGNLGADEAARREWYHHWVMEGFRAIETMLAAHGSAGPYCLGKDVSLADIFIVAQVYNARRFEVPLEGYPRIVGIEAACLALDAFERARPENQPDAPGV
jgi:maleylacetoacetate isomerase